MSSLRRQTLGEGISDPRNLSRVRALAPPDVCVNNSGVSAEPSLIWSGSMGAGGSTLGSLDTGWGCCASPAPWSPREGWQALGIFPGRASAHPAPGRRLPGLFLPGTPSAELRRSPSSDPRRPAARNAPESRPGDEAPPFLLAGLFHSSITAACFLCALIPPLCPNPLSVPVFLLHAHLSSPVPRGSRRMTPG